MKKILVLDIGGTFIKYGLITEGKLGLVQKQATPKTNDALKKCLTQIYNEFVETVDGVSISMPGIINADTGFAVHGGSLEFIRQMNMLEFFQSIFDCPVAIDNDARCAIIGEMNLGQLQGVNDAIMIVLGTGVGGGLLVNGQIVRGANQSAGELSFVQTNSSMATSDFFAVKNSVYSLLKPFAKSLNKKTSEVNGELFFEAVKMGNQVAQSILHTYCDSLALQLWNLQTILDPEKIVIGGGISSQTILLDYLKQDLQKIIDSLAISPVTQIISPSVVLSSLGNDASLIGAYFNYVQRYDS
ncbi:ROK family protein [Candidatus Enterococcus ikei]|uniref:ROK family protein n=1 Tax=Candidatus Enterococcus ikei TaxID=2815326 RepID=A0ABS3H120_9ENTE|nr:ROK family protein [Enterococcus sp. DIV0869a]MBO0440858.1 ROK family protein [Enterococcus sp. DIV0869a]